MATNTINPSTIINRANTNQFYLLSVPPPFDLSVPFTNDVFVPRLVAAKSPVAAPISHKEIIDVLNQVNESLSPKLTIAYSSPNPEKFQRWVVALAETHLVPGQSESRGIFNSHINAVSITDALASKLGKSLAKIQIEGDKTNYPNSHLATSNPALTKAEGLKELITVKKYSYSQIVTTRYPDFITKSESQQTTDQGFAIMLTKAMNSSTMSLTNSNIQYLAEMIRLRASEADLKTINTAKLAEINAEFDKISRDFKADSKPLYFSTVLGFRLNIPIFKAETRNNDMRKIGALLLENIKTKEKETVQTTDAALSAGSFTILNRGALHLINTKSNGAYQGLIEMYQDKDIGVIVVYPAGLTIK